MAFTIAGTGTPAGAADIRSQREAYPEERPPSGGLTETQVLEFCHRQRKMCRKICVLRDRFEDRFDGCPSSCDSRELRCESTACFQWREPELVIGERFGATRCIR